MPAPRNGSGLFSLWRNMTLARDTSTVNWSNRFIPDEASPSGLRWKDGDIAGSLLKYRGGKRYWTVYVGDQTYLVHRIIWELVHGRLHTLDNIDHYNGDGSCNSLDNLKKKSHRANCQNKKMQTTNTSGVVGVYLNNKTGRDGQNIQYWMASWVDSEHVQRTKCFRIDRLGNDVAFLSAKEYRERMIQELNTQGQGYTPRHGVVNE